jgi:manganese transport protein
VFTARGDIMGTLRNSRLTTAAAGAVAALIVALNIFLLATTLL